MSESQRRYLFRLLAAQGLQGEAAHDHLKGHFEVEALDQVTKAEASDLIDELTSPAPEKAPGRGGAAALQH